MATQLTILGMQVDDTDRKGISVSRFTPQNLSIRDDDGGAAASSNLNKANIWIQGSAPADGKGRIVATVYKSDNTVASTLALPMLQGNVRVALSPAATSATFGSSSSHFHLDCATAEYGTGGLTAARIEYEFYGFSNTLRFEADVLNAIQGSLGKAVSYTVSGGGVMTWKIPFKVETV